MRDISPINPLVFCLSLATASCLVKKAVTATASWSALETSTFATRRWIYAVSIAGGLWGIWGLFHLTVHTDYLRYFRASAPVVQAATEFHERLAGIAPLSIVVVESSGSEKLLTLRFSNAVEALQQALNSGSPTVDTTLSSR